jgi:hypothetical protein
VPSSGCFDSGTLLVGGNGGANKENIALTFPAPFAHPPVVLLTARGKNYQDTFVASTREVTTTGCKVNIVRVDCGGLWAQKLELDWIAMPLDVGALFIAGNQLAPPPPPPPALTTLYHGTDGKNAESIINSGLRISTHPNARIGPGVYFTLDKEHAKTVAIDAARRNGSGGNPRPFVVTCQVITGRQYDFDQGSTHGNGTLCPKSQVWANYSFQSATSMHPAWGGIPAPFREVCVHSIGAVRIESVEGIIIDQKPSCRGTHAACGNDACRANKVPFCVSACPLCPDAQ